MSRLSRVALFQLGAMRSEVYVEYVELLIAMHDISVFVDPYQRVFNSLRRRISGFVNSDVDGEGILFGCLLQATDKGAFRSMLT
jgi:hypothetical protein